MEPGQLLKYIDQNQKITCPTDRLHGKVTRRAFIDTDHRVSDPFLGCVSKDGLHRGRLDAVKFSHAEEIHSSSYSGGDGMVRIDEC